MSIWNKFYKTFNEDKPSPFAKWVKGFDLKEPIIDLGCGNGRDAKYLNCTGVDVAELPEHDFDYVQQDVRDFIKTPCKYKTVYSRFFFHSVPPDVVKDILEWNTGLLLAEFRVVGDKPTLHTDHDRWFIDTEWLKSAMTGYIGFIYIDRGLAPYKGEDPLIGRVVARRAQ